MVQGGNIFLFIYLLIAVFKRIVKFKSTRIATLIAFALAVNYTVIRAQNSSVSDFFPDIQVLESNGPAEGYYFMGSKGLTAAGARHYIAIIDNFGTPVFFRLMDKATSSFRPVNNGKLAYMHGVPRKWHMLDDILKLEKIVGVQEYQPNGHDWNFAENGHLLLLGKSSRTVDMSSLVEGGNTNAEALDLIVQEFDEDFNLIYTWNSANHFDIFDGNENSDYLDFTEKQIDYNHANAITTDSDTSFLVSSRHMDEITKIDRRTGEIIWRLGGKKNEFTFINDELGFSHQHSIQALENGNILLFDNGNLHNPQVSSTVEYTINETEKTATLVKRYNRRPDVYSNHGGATQRVHNGNTIISWGPYWPSVTEFHPDGTPALEWDFTKHSFCPRIEKYEWETTIFETDQHNIDFGHWETDTVTKSVWIKNNLENTLLITSVDSRTNYFGMKTALPVTISGNDSVEVSLWFYPQFAETGYFTDVLTIASDSETERIARQVQVTGRKEDLVSPQAQLLTPENEIEITEKIQVKLSEPIKIFEGGELNHTNIDAFVRFRKNDAFGEEVLANVIISTDKTVVSVIPENPLEFATAYYLAFDAGLADYAENKLEPFETIISTVLTGNKEILTPQINVYPNPVSDVLTITGDFAFIQSLKIFNAQSVICLEKEIQQNDQSININIKHFPKGIYVLHFITDKNRIVKKVIKY